MCCSCAIQRSKWQNAQDRTNIQGHIGDKQVIHACVRNRQDDEPSVPHPLR